MNAMNAMRFGGVVAMLVALTAGCARANGGTLTLHGDRAVVVGRLDEGGVVVVNDALALVLHAEGLDLVPVGSWIEAEGQLLPGARKQGRRVLLRLRWQRLDVIAEAQERMVTGDMGGPNGLEDVIRGAHEDAPGRAELALLAAVDAALADRRLERAEWEALRAAWRAVEQGDAEARARAADGLTRGSWQRQAIYTGLCGDLPWEDVARLLGQHLTIVPATRPVEATPARSP